MAEQKMFHQYDELFAPRQHVDTLMANAKAVGGPSYEFFKDLDTYTEYSDVYRPELNGKYMAMVGILFPGAVKLWTRYALAEKTPNGSAALQTLNNELDKGKVRDSILQIDALLHDLLKQHFPGSGDLEIDGDAYLATTELFARDAFPDDPERLGRLTEDDDRRANALRHRMDGTSMWFSWGAVIDCASMLPDSGGILPHRTLMLAGCAFGSAMDFVFRNRGRTRPEYKPDPSTETILRNSAKVWATDGAESRAQVRDLYRVFSS